MADFLRSEIGEPTYLDGFVRVDYEWSPATRGSLHALLANDEAEINNSEETEHADASYSNTYVWGTLTHDWSEQLSANGAGLVHGRGLRNARHACWNLASASAS